MAPGTTEEDYLEADQSQGPPAPTTPAVTTTRVRKGAVAAAVLDTTDAHTDASSEGSFTSTSSVKRARKEVVIVPPESVKPPRSSQRISEKHRFLEESAEDMLRDATGETAAADA